MVGSLCTTIFLTGCNNTVNNTINNDLTIDNDANIDINVNNTEVSNIQNIDMLLTVEIEQVELDDFKTGYKLPAGYVPYNVDSEYHLPGLLPVAEMTDEYTIFELPTVTDGYGNDVEVSYEGSISVYKSYAQFLALNRDVLNKYAKASYIDTTEDYSFATKEEQETLVQIDFLHDKVSEAYSMSKGVRLKKIIILIFFNFQTISTLY